MPRPRPSRSPLHSSPLPVYQVGAWARVTLTDGSKKLGVLHAVDPESGHVVLLQPAETSEAAVVGSAQGSSVRPLIVFRHSVALIEQRAQDATVESPQDMRLERASGADSRGEAVDEHQASPTGTAEACDARRQAIKDLLLAERLPYEEDEDGTFIILERMRFAPPYTAAMCQCENEVILDRVFEALSRAAPALFSALTS